MPFTTCNYLDFASQEGWRPDTTFYPQDITIVMAQDGAVSTRVMSATFSDTGGAVECMVLIALDANLDPMADDHHFAALSCPPLNENGGVFKPKPKT